MTIPELMTTGEVALKLHQAESTIRGWCSSGKLPATKIGRNWLITVDDVVALIDRNHNQTGAQALDAALGS